MSGEELCCSFSSRSVVNSLTWDDFDCFTSSDGIFIGHGALLVKALFVVAVVFGGMLVHTVGGAAATSLASCW